MSVSLSLSSSLSFVVLSLSGIKLSTSFVNSVSGSGVFGLLLLFLKYTDPGTPKVISNKVKPIVCKCGFIFSFIFVIAFLIPFTSLLCFPYFLYCLGSSFSFSFSCLSSNKSISFLSVVFSSGISLSSDCFSLLLYKFNKGSILDNSF